MVEITAPELKAAESIFGDRLELAKRYVEHLATSGTERGLIGPPQRAVADANPDVVVAHPLQRRPRPLGQTRQTLDGTHAARQLGQHRGLVAGAGTDLQHLLAARELQQRGHEPDDERLRDRLLLADRQRVIAVCTIL